MCESTVSNRDETLQEGECPAVDPVDAAALHFVKSWHQYPELQEALFYHGVNLGEVNEYLLLPEIITVLIEREEGRLP